MPHRKSVFSFGFIFTIICLLPNATFAADWPMWRHDARRSAATAEQLATKLYLQWTRELPALAPTWPDQPKLESDGVYSPIVMDGTMFVGSSQNDSLTAYDLTTGEQKWRFYADGPIRFAPVGWKEKVYFSSDDGYLYCLQAVDGSLNWKFRGGPTDRKVLGNQRVISAWPARGAPVLKEGTIYMTASIWPFMGIFIHALDAETGKVQWTNDNTGSLYTLQPHNSSAFAGLAPQGYLAAVGNRLIIPNGRAVPACLDRTTGELMYFHHARHSRSGGYRVAASEKLFFCGPNAFDLETGTGFIRFSPEAPPVISGETLYYGDHGIVAYDGNPTVTEVKDRRGRKVFSISLKKKWSFHDGINGIDLQMQAGSRLYGSLDKSIVAVDLPTQNSPTHVSWSSEIDGTVSNMLATDGQLVVTTREGKIICFGPKQTKPRDFLRNETADATKANAETIATATSIIEQSEVTTGYCIAVGLKDGRLIEQLARQTELQIIAFDADAKKVDAIRRRLNAAGLYGTRIAVHAIDPLLAQFPVYLASLVVSEDLQSAGFGSQEKFVNQIFQPLRPYGGIAMLPVPEKQHAGFRRAVEAADLPQAQVSRETGFTILKRAGALPGSADWTHQYADASNSIVSNDRLVKAPLGLLWFGGTSNDKILPRHGHGPSPQVAGGRLFIEGPDILRCSDVYTGRLLWEREFKGLGSYYNITSHFAGAGEIGSNYVSLPDRVYVVYGNKLLELDAATGKTQKEFRQADSQGKSTPHWGFLAVDGDYLVATSGPVTVDEKGKQKASSILNVLKPARYSSASRRLVIFNRHTGKQLWSRDAVYNFRHNGIAVAAGKVFCIDGMSPKKMEVLRRRGITDTGKSRLLALNVKTGEEAWSTADDAFGTFLSYSAKHNVLLQAGSAYRDRAKDEVSRGMVAYRANDGKVLWKNLKQSYNGPCLLWRDKIITNGAGGFQLDLLTGETTGWTYARQYGCNTAIGSENLLTFRSAAAGFCDLDGNSGTGNLGGFRASCTANLIVADGVLNAPDYTRTCSCGYQNQTSLAFIHMPEVELWTFNQREIDDDAQRIGINLGAPGDRRSDEGTLWLEYPVVGGPSPKIEVQVSPEQPKWFSYHSSRIRGDGLKWVGASGAEGIQQVRLKLKKIVKGSRSFTVRLYFAEPRNLQTGQRLFSVDIQGQRRLEQFDIAREAGGTNWVVVKEFHDIPIQDELTIELSPVGKSPKFSPILCGIEVIAAKN